MLNIKPFHHDGNNCWEDKIAIVSYWKNYRYELMFSNDWAFEYSNVNKCYSSLCPKNTKQKQEVMQPNSPNPLSMWIKQHLKQRLFFVLYLPGRTYVDGAISRGYHVSGAMKSAG